MNLLQNRKFAIAAAIVIVLASTVFGVHRSAGAEAGKVEQMFQRGVDGSGYGIAGDLSDRLDYAQNLCKIAAAADGTEQAVTAVQDARLALDTAKEHSTQFAANETLTEAVYMLDAALKKTGYESADWTRYLQNFDSKGMTIAHEAAKFNEQVQAYQDTVASSLLVRLVGAAEPLEEFA